MIADELKIVVEVLGNEIGMYMELLGNEDDVFRKSKGEPMDIVDEVRGGNSTLGCKGNLGINGSVDELVVEFIYDVTTYKDESLASIIMECNWEPEGLLS